MKYAELHQLIEMTKELNSLIRDAVQNAFRRHELDSGEREKIKEEILSILRSVWWKTK